MKKILSLLLFAMAFVGTAEASTVSGTIKNSNGTAQANGTVTFIAVGCPPAQMTVTSTGAVATNSYTFTANSSGVWSGTVLGNDAMSCPGGGSSQYAVSEYTSSHQLLLTKIFTLTDASAFSPDTASSTVVAPVGFLANPIISQGDIIIGGPNGIPIRLAKGSSGTYLGSNGTTPSWMTISGLGGSYLPLAGGTMTGPIVLPGAPTTNLQAADKAYVDGKLSCTQTYVQITSNAALTSTNGTTVDTPVTLGTSAVPNDALFAVVHSVGTTGGAFSSISGVTDSQGNTYTLLQSTSLSEDHYAVYYAVGIIGGADTITAHASGSTPEADITVFEYKGIAPTSPLDASFVNGWGPGTLPQTYSITTSVANDLIIVIGLVNGSETITGFTQRTGGTTAPTVNDQIATGTGSQSIAVTASTGAGWAGNSQIVAAAFFQTTGCTTGPAGPQGPAGSNGTNGTNGTNGSNGTNGNTVLNGTSNPSSGTGSNGDFYLNTSTDVLWGPKASGAWPGSGTALIGATGSAGINGNTILNGTINPTSGNGNNGDFYLNTTTSVLWGPKASGAWPGSGTSLIGPTGPSGGGGGGGAGPTQVVSYTATPAFDASTGAGFKITLTGNVTSSTLTNSAADQTQVSFMIVQDATGGRTFVWPTNVINPGTISATANSISIQHFMVDPSTGNVYPIGPMSYN